MAAFDTALTPVSIAPSDTNNTALDPANTTSAYVYVDVANITTTTISVRVGITPNGGSVHWKLYDVPIVAGDSITGLGPWFLEADDVVTCRTSDADDAVFSLTGVESSA